ncbi:hypothetical protein M432DRAFT_635353 [Thermoascus aurantiacus ATCC 26904]
MSVSVKTFLKRFRRRRRLPVSPHSHSPPDSPRGKNNKKRKKEHQDEEEIIETDDDNNCCVYDDDGDQSTRSGSGSSEMGMDRVTSWASIVTGTGSTSRWTAEQELELCAAEEELARYQSNQRDMDRWSLEQERKRVVWLEQIKTFIEEKKAHEAFIQMRTRQQDDERHRFRKAWKRRRRQSLQGGNG